MEYDIADYNQIDFVDKEELSAKARNVFYKLKEQNIHTRNLLAKSNRFIPRTTSLFIGYEIEMKELADSLETNKIVSVVGPGGIGKSSLISKVLEKLDFNNIIYVSLSPESTLENMLSLIEQQISYPCSTSEELTSFLAQLENTVIFVDNYEIVSSSIYSAKSSAQIRLLHKFFNSIPDNIRLIVASRNRKNFETEYLLALSGLKQEDGTDLFLNLTRRWHRRHSEEFMESVSKVVQEVEGHPLAINLIARSYVGGGTSEIKSAYTNIVKLKNNMETDIKLSSLKSCFYYSYKRLSNKDKKILIQLIGFKSPFSIDAFSFVFPGLNRNLAILTNASFLKQYDLIFGKDDKKLYAFHALIRSFLAEYVKETHLETGMKISNYYVDFIRQAYANLQKSNYEFIPQLIRYILKEEPNDLEISIERLDNPIEKSILYNELALLLEKLGFIKKSMEVNMKALNIDKGLRNPEFVADDYVIISRCFIAIGNYNEGIIYGEKALKIFQDLNNEKKAHSVYLNLAGCYLEMDQINKSKQYVDQASGIAKTLKDNKSLAQQTGMEAKYHFHLGQYVEAMDALKKSKELDEQLGLRDMVAVDLRNMGIYRYLA